MKRALQSLAAIAFTYFVVGCATVDITKTGKGYFPPTNPNDVDILMTVPVRNYVELATVTTNGHDIRHEAKMHNAIRAKAAPVGANAVIIQSQGIVPAIGGGCRWTTGVAIRYQ